MARNILFYLYTYSDDEWWMYTVKFKLYLPTNVKLYSFFILFFIRNPSVLYKSKLYKYAESSNVVWWAFLTFINNYITFFKIL